MLLGLPFPHGVGIFRLIRTALGDDLRSTMIVLFVIIICVAIYLHRRR